MYERASSLCEYAAARAVGAYIAMPAEVQTAKLLDTCWRDGKAVCVPAFEPDRERYIFARAGSGTALKKGLLGIPEPAERAPVDFETPAIVFVPGLAFDANGGRLGHGGGHYDSLLRGLADVFKIGLAFDFQLVERVPITSGDVAMNAVVTNTKVIRVEDDEDGSTL